MSNIELIIKVPEKLVCEGFERLFTEEERKILINAIGNAILLPKGHGDIVDADKAFDLLNKEIDKHDKMMAKYQPYSNNQIPLWWWKGICNESVFVRADEEREE
jgi:hypothetical protein